MQVYDSCENDGVGMYISPPGYKNYGERSSWVTAIVIRSTDGLSHEKVFYKYATGRNESVHYLIGIDGRVDSFAPLLGRVNYVKNNSHWGGKEDVNDFSIGIALVTKLPPLVCYSTPYSNYGKRKNGECDVSGYSSFQMESLLKLLKCLKPKYSIKDKNIIAASDADPDSADPGVAFDWNTLHRKGYGEYSYANVTKTVTQEALLARDANHTAIFQGYLRKIGHEVEITGVQDEQFALVVRSFQLHHSSVRSLSATKVWGILDMETFAKAEELAGLNVEYEGEEEL